MGKGDVKFQNPLAEEARLRGLYRRLVLEGRMVLPFRALKPLVGPDCAYHLYKLEIGNDGDIMDSKVQNIRGGSAMAKVVTYECNECGCEIVVTEAEETELAPIYCCGTMVEEVAPKKKAAAKPKKKAAAKKTVKAKKTAAKKPAAKKKAKK